MIFNLMDNARRSKGLELAYTGTMQQTSITVDGAAYTLYTITDSGTLTVKGKGTMDIWCCGGGANGGLGTSGAKNGYGGGGGYFAQADAQTLAAGNYTVTIGAAQGSTSIAKGDNTVLTAAGATNQNGGSGGGGMGQGINTSNNAAAGTGQGTSTRPFGDSVNFTSLPCAGGGGSGSYVSSYDGSSYEYYSGAGGAGGTNGGTGRTGTRAELGYDNGTGGSGGATGGGRGANDNGSKATAGSYYGAGGGGKPTNTTSMSGYQGVMYIRVPA